MKALMHTAFGPPRDVLRLRDIETPRVEPHQVLVRIHATSIAKGDWLITRGLPYIARPAYGMRTPKEPVAGLAFAGRVEAVGREASRFAPGDEVFGTHAGALAEYVAVPETALALKPAAVTFAQAAAVPVSGLTALQAVRDGANVQPGQRVLVVGASGAVGSFAVQIAKAFGAHVTGVASTRNLDLLRTIGADAVVDYTRERITDGGARYDAIIDIAGNRSVAQLRRALTPRGTLVIVGGTGGKLTMGFGRTIGGMLLSRFVPQRIVGLLSNPNQDDLRTLADLMQAGTLAPVIDESGTLDDAPEAVELAGNGHGRGVIVVTV